jgi:hypothetical protein
MAYRLRARDVSALDRENIAEEIESMGKRDYRALTGRMAARLSTNHTQRERIGMIVADSPGFRLRIEADMQGLYAIAKQRASLETTMSLKNVPNECPWTFESALKEPLNL